MNPDTNRLEPLHPAPEEESRPQRPLDESLALGAIKRLAGEIAPTQKQASALASLLVRPNGEPVPAHWTTFTVGEQAVIKGYTFRVAYIGESAILFEPVGPVSVSP